MKWLMTIDQKLFELGFEKIKENRQVVVYLRRKEITELNYDHEVDLIWKTFQREYILQSYDPNLFDTEATGNTCIGLNEEELKLFYKKIKELNYNRNNFD